MTNEVVENQAWEEKCNKSKIGTIGEKLHVSYYISIPEVGLKHAWTCAAYNIWT